VHVGADVTVMAAHSDLLCVCVVKWAKRYSEPYTRTPSQKRLPKRWRLHQHTLFNKTC